VSLLASVEALLRLLQQRNVHGCLVGGLAVSVRCDPRFTLDADIAVAVSNDSEAEAQVRFLVQAGYVVTATAEQQAVGRLAMVRFVDHTHTSIDVLFASSGIESDIVEASERLEVVPGLVLPVARVGHLIAMKLLSVAAGRETDAADLRHLGAEADAEEWQCAQVAVQLIMDRGYGRGRDLAADLAALRTSE
jgi:hypothetical protein